MLLDSVFYLYHSTESEGNKERRFTVERRATAQNKSEQAHNSPQRELSSREDARDRANHIIIGREKTSAPCEWSDDTSCAGICISHTEFPQESSTCKTLTLCGNVLFWEGRAQQGYLTLLSRPDYLMSAPINATAAKKTTKTMVILKTSFSTPRRVLKVEIELEPPNALPSPAPRTWSRIKKITAALKII